METFKNKYLKNIITYRRHINSFLLSYSQIFFSTNRILGSILFIVSFIDYWSGIFGAFSVLTSLFVANRLGFDKKAVQAGALSYNSLLTGLGIGLYFQPSLPLLVFTFFVSLMVLMLSVGISRFLAYYGLPSLSIPFILGIWMVDLSANSFNSLGLSDRSIYHLNYIYSLGGQSLIDFYEWVSTIPILYSIEVYFLSLGAIFFQYHVLAGVIISIGLLIHSRITFVLSLIGFYAAWLFYFILGASLYDLSYSYIGFNFILTSVALGGYYLIPNRYSFAWMLLVLPTVVLTTIASMALFSHFNIGIYALPFNIVVILFIYINKLRVKEKYELKEVITQHNSPEKNLYFSLQAEERFMDLKYLPISLPIRGEWTVSQAHNGKYTHQDKWKHAWDFVITNQKGLEFNNEGNIVSDYLCYEKNVVAAYEGFVQEVSNGIEENEIGKNNLRNNWGNTIIIKHADYLYSKYSHLKKGSIVVQKGDWIRKGQLIAKVGNSGRSPYPHLHFQMQATPYIGSETIEYPFASYITKDANNNIDLKLYDFPQNEDKVQITQSNELLIKALKLEVGRELLFDIEHKGEKQSLKWLVKTDILKNTYIHCEESHSFAYFHNDGELTFFKNFSGDHKSALYHFFLAFNKIHESFYTDVILKDEIALHLSNQPKWKMVVQDFVAPFYIYLKTQYSLKYIDMDDDLSPSKLKIQSTIKYMEYKKMIGRDIYDINIHTRGIIEFSNKEKDFYAKQKI